MFSQSADHHDVRLASGLHKLMILTLLFSSRFTMTTLLMPPPYNFSSSDIGLMEIAALIGFVIACFGGGYMSDFITQYIVKKSNGVIRPEQRLVSLLPGMLVAPAGCILLAFACQNQLNWVAIAFGFGMGKYLSFQILLTIDLHRSIYLTVASFIWRGIYTKYCSYLCRSPPSETRRPMSRSHQHFQKHSRLSISIRGC